ncbi:MAG: AAA family ATPase [Lachnospiraceae bacterium]|nr:AAA family ATPase [Lachnospiraceae bacterium]
MAGFDTKIVQKMANLLRARFPYIYITTWEEERAVEFVKATVSDEKTIKTIRKVYQWSQSKGFQDEEGRVRNNTSTPAQAIDFIVKNSENAVFILKDFHVYFGIDHRPIDFDVIRRLRDALPELKYAESMKNVIFISPRLVIPEDMQKEISIFDFPLPSEDELRGKLDEMLFENSSLRVLLDEEEKQQLAKSARGLTLQEAENAFARAIVTRGCLDKESLKIIFEEKNQVIKKTGILEFIQSDLGVEDIGGLENLKKWLQKRNNSWSSSAKKYNIPSPKGVLITGVPGCGKSLTAKAMSAMWTLPLLKLDLGKIFSGIVGSSEENMRRALKTAEAVAPSILWVDEIEKGLSGVGNGSNGDSGTSSRVFGTFLTWMQEKESPVFVVATANNIQGLPPELLRKGRFDEIFFVDLPTRRERKEIFQLHLNRRLNNDYIGRDLEVNDGLLERLADQTEGFVGAEVEQAVISALYEAFFNQRPLLEKDLQESITNTVPLSVTQKEQILALRQWANVRAVAATAREDLKEYLSDEKSEEPGDVKSSRGGRNLDF